MLVLGMEECIRKKNAIVRYGAASQKDVREIIHPLMGILTQSCPPDLKPYWVQSAGKYYFPGRDSFMVVSGLDEGRAENLRGTYMDLGLLDECQNVSDLDNVVKSVLMPQCLTTDGRILMSGTSPKNSSHPFVGYIREAEREHGYKKLTIHDDSRPEVAARIEEWKREAGGEHSTTWRREYLCEIITDEESAIVPEFSKPEVRERVVTPIEVPPYFIPYTVIDLGYIDHTAALFGFVDFRRSKICILDELTLNRSNSKVIAESIIQKEKDIWGTNFKGDVKREPRRYADAQPITIADFNSIHKLAVTKASNDDLEAEVNELRLFIQAIKVEIAPNCVQLVQQLQDGIWDAKQKKFERLPGYGHFDLVATLMYFVRHANLRENPYPENFDWSVHTHVIHKKDNDGYLEDALKKAFRLKK